MREIMAMVVLCSAAIAAPAASAQQTTGIITGQLIDAQGSAVPGVTVTDRHAATEFTSGQRPAAFRRTSGRSEQRIMLFDRERTTGDALH